MLSYKKLLCLIVLFISTNLFAEPFDSSGLIDLKTAGTKRGSCVVVGSLFNNSIKQIKAYALLKSSKEQVSELNKQKEQAYLEKMGREAELYAEALTADRLTSNEVHEDFVQGVQRTSSLFQFSAVLHPMEPSKILSAWKFCGATYGFLQN
jgi:hypothetical protein